MLIAPTFMKTSGKSNSISRVAILKGKEEIANVQQYTNQG